jgi:hypothetical protein
MKEQHIKINFSAGGWMDQDILITDSNYSPEDIINGLQNESIITTIQENGELVDTTDGKWKVIGTVIASESSLEYRNFDMDGTYELVVDEKENTFNATKLALGAAVGEVIGETGEQSCSDIMEQLNAIDNKVASHVSDLDIVEQYELLTGNQLVGEIVALQRGFTSLMKVAYDAGRDGKELI